MAWYDSLIGSSGQLKQLNKFTPQQQGLQNQALGQFGPLLQQLQKPADIEPILNQRRQAFNEQTIPSIAERFTSLGGGAQRSSAFQNALGRAGSDLETQLAGLQSQVGLQDLNRQQSLLSMLGQIGLTPSFEHFYQQGQSGLLGNTVQGLGQIAPYLLPLLLGAGTGGVGLAAGAGAGGIVSILSSLLGGRQQPGVQ
jgi:hypothetical protein